MLKVGNYVRVKETAGTKKEYPGFNVDMEAFRGKICQIERVDLMDEEIPYYFNGFWWKDSWVEPVDMAKISVSSNDLMELLDG